MLQPSNYSFKDAREALAHAEAVAIAVEKARREAWAEEEFAQELRALDASEERRRRVDNVVSTLVAAMGVGIFLSLAVVFGKGSMR
jgi:hypothetical protein